MKKLIGVLLTAIIISIIGTSAILLALISDKSNVSFSGALMDFWWIPIFLFVLSFLALKYIPIGNNK
jgi:hypothetical protein